MGESKPATMDFTVVGMKFRGYKPADIVSTYSASIITLEPEPTNPYDAKAIKVLVEGKHMGYVTKDDCARVQEYMTANPMHAFEVVDRYAASVIVTITAVDIPTDLIEKLNTLTLSVKAAQPTLPLPA